MTPFNLRLKLDDEKYPIPAYNFRVTLASTTMGFCEVSGLALEHKTVTYRHGLSFREGELIQACRYDKYVPVTMTKGVVRGATRLYRWFKSMDARNLDVSLCDPEGMLAITWHIAKALPVKLTGPSLGVEKDEVAIDSFELMASGISIEHH
jgi:phage tail-like protein